MAKKTHPYLRKEFWENNQYWNDDLHAKHEVYEERIENIINSFKIKQDHIFDRMKVNN